MGLEPRAGVFMIAEKISLRAEGNIVDKPVAAAFS